jgi:uncharacterized protein YecE (DUF72 family)
VTSGLFIGSAGWTIPKAHSHAFLAGGAGLVRYASIFNAAEINSATPAACSAR